MTLAAGNAETAVPLNRLEPYTFGKHRLQIYQNFSSVNNRGGTYTFGFEGFMCQSDGENSCTYALDQPYRYLTGTVAVTGGASDRCGIIRIYGDGRLLWADENLKSSTAPYEITVDISGVSDLKVEMYAAEGDDGPAVLLGEPMLLI